MEVPKPREKSSFCSRNNDASTPLLGHPNKQFLSEIERAAVGALCRGAAIFQNMPIPNHPEHPAIPQEMHKYPSSKDRSQSVKTKPRMCRSEARHRQVPALAPEAHPRRKPKYRADTHNSRKGRCHAQNPRTTFAKHLRRRNGPGAPPRENRRNADPVVTTHVTPVTAPARTN